jgi:hypothetical protein
MRLANARSGHLKDLTLERRKRCDIMRDFIGGADLTGPPILSKNNGRQSNEAMPYVPVPCLQASALFAEIK